MGCRVAVKAMPGRKRAPRKAAKKEPARVSVSALARSLGVSHTAVQKAVKSGRLRECLGRDRRGVFVADVKLARKEWKAGATKPGKAASSRLVDVQVKVATERARVLRLEADLKAGKLLDAEEVKRDVFEAARVTRDNVMNVPDRVAAELAAESDPARVHARLGDELEKALEAVGRILENQVGEGGTA